MDKVFFSLRRVHVLNKRSWPISSLWWSVCLFAFLGACAHPAKQPSVVKEQIQEEDKVGLSDSGPLDPDNSSLEGQWKILEKDKSYVATLDSQGNGTYTWQSGILKTTEFKNREWRGTWRQSGNDREGGFELFLSKDGMKAKGVWWYTRVGNKDHIPEKKYGGRYIWIRLPVTSGEDNKN